MLNYKEISNEENVYLEDFSIAKVVGKGKITYCECCISKNSEPIKTQ